VGVEAPDQPARRPGDGRLRRLGQIGATKGLSAKVYRPPSRTFAEFSPAPSKDRWLALAVTSDAYWQALRVLMGDPRWARDPALAAAGRRAAYDRIDREIGAWCVPRDADALAEELVACGIPAAPVVPASRLPRNPLIARGFFETVSIRSSALDAPRFAAESSAPHGACDGCCPRFTILRNRGSCRSHGRGTVRVKIPCRVCGIHHGDRER
jgi:crotonobetainyl-CoA:carnitine CoA-transferase CaiB-like acyl-CoA transferase